MREFLRENAALPVRLILGAGFVFHGFSKLFAPGGHAGFVGMLKGIGVPAPELAAWGVGAIEFFGGIALIIGAFVGVVALLQIGIMLVALFTLHINAGFSFMNVIGMTEAGPQFGLPGFEVNLVYIAGLASLVLGGAGPLSVDRVRALLRSRSAHNVPARRVTGESAVPVSA